MLTCRCCEGVRLERVLDLGCQPWGNDFIPIAEGREASKYPLELYLCLDCRMAQIGYTVPKEVMFHDHHYMSGTTRSLRAHFEGVAESILERVSLGDGLIVDIGGNDGTFLKSFASRGFRCINVDSGWRQAERSAQNGIPCLNEYFDLSTARHLVAEHGKARVVHGSGIFFHLERLHEVFDGVRELLEPGGLLVGEFIYLPEMLRKCAFDQIYHEHLLYYSLATFSEVLRRHGLEVHDAAFAPIHGGSCIAFCGHEGDREPSRRLLAALEDERRAGVGELATYRLFAERVQALRTRLRGMVLDLRERGARIQTLGAPVKGSTIINFCGLSENEIECATEINELKVGTYIPGTRIPVRDQAATPAPDVYLLLAWNFKDEILSHLDDFRGAGGRVLVPIPEPTLI